MQKEEYLIKNACYSVTKYYLCKQNNKRSLLGRKQRSQVARSFPNRYQFSCTNKVTSLFSISCILRIILPCKTAVLTTQNNSFCKTLIISWLSNNYTPEMHFYRCTKLKTQKRECQFDIPFYCLLRYEFCRNRMRKQILLQCKQKLTSCVVLLYLP